MKPNNDIPERIRPRYLKLPASARYMSVGQGLLKELIEDGKIRAIMVGRSSVIDTHDMDRFMATAKEVSHA